MKTPLDPYDPIDPKTQRNLFTRLKEAYPGWVQTPYPFIKQEPPPIPQRSDYMPYRGPAREVEEYKPKPLTIKEIDEIYFKRVRKYDN